MSVKVYVAQLRSMADPLLFLQSWLIVCTRSIKSKTKLTKSQGLIFSQAGAMILSLGSGTTTLRPNQGREVRSDYADGLGQDRNCNAVPPRCAELTSHSFQTISPHEY